MRAIKGIVEFEEKDFRASGYPPLFVMVPDTTPYYSVVTYSSNTDDVCADAILDDLLNKHSEVWHRLSKM